MISECGLRIAEWRYFRSKKYHHSAIRNPHSEIGCRFGVCKKVKTNIPTRVMSSEWRSSGRTVDGNMLNVTIRSQAQRFFLMKKRFLQSYNIVS
jgi:hypothetical protein